MVNEQKTLVILGGPTASGKTAKSIELAQAFGTEIISADSRQIYKELTIGTAKPTKEELVKIPHHFINHLSIHEPFSAGDYGRQAREQLTQLFRKYRFVICTGGTGFYIQALLGHLPIIPAVPETVLNQVEKDFTEQEKEKLLEEIQQLDPEYYLKADLQNERRLIRALAVMRSTGKRYTEFLQNRMAPLDCSVIRVALQWPTDQLNTRIDKRVEQMFELGLLDEAKELLPHADLRALQTVGYKETFQHLRKEIDLDTCKELIKTHTRQYAKRQRTWFRNQGEWLHLPPEEITPEKIAKLVG